jgi:hypothetical protein
MTITGLDLLAQKHAPAVTRMEVPVTHWPRWRFTIAKLMIAVAIVAIMLAVPAAVCVIVIALVMSTRDQTNPHPARNAPGFAVLAPVVLPIVRLLRFPRLRGRWLVVSGV